MNRRLLLVAAAVLAIFMVPAPASAQTWKQWDRARVNFLRAQHHESPLVYRASLQDEAQRWAEREAATGFARQNLNVGPCWSITTATQFGDNVAVAWTVPMAQYALERSPSHRANMLDRGYRFLGIGIARSNGWVWMDQVFCG